MQRFDARQEGSCLRRVPCGECRWKCREEPLDRVRRRLAIHDDAIRGTEGERGLPGMSWGCIAADFDRRGAGGRALEPGVVPWPCLGAGGVSVRRLRRACARGWRPAATVLEGRASARWHAAARSRRLLALLHDSLTPNPCTPLPQDIMDRQASAGQQESAVCPSLDVEGMGPAEAGEARLF